MEKMFPKRQRLGADDSSLDKNKSAGPSSQSSGEIWSVTRRVEMGFIGVESRFEAKINLMYASSGTGASMPGKNKTQGQAFMELQNGDEMASKRVLIVDDEKELLGLVSLHMKMAGFEVITASDGETAMAICRESKPDLIILDLMLPELDGWEVCKMLKENPKTQSIPVMILTAMAEVDDRLRGFDIGADDYVTKPFSPRELVARVKRILDRCHVKPKQKKNIALGFLEIDTQDFDVRMKGREVLLTEKEKAILKLLVSRSGQLITHEQLIDEVWGDEHIVEYGNIAVHVRHLREKIEEDPEHPKIIKTIKGLGYRFDFD